MAGPCGVTEQPWPYACSIDANNGFRWDPVAQRLWAYPGMKLDGVDVVYANEFPAAGAVGLLQVSPTQTVRFYNPSACLPFIAYITHQYGIHIENDYESAVNVTQFAAFAVNAPAPAPVIGETMTAVIPFTAPGFPFPGYDRIVQPDWFSPITIPPGGYVETNHFMVVSGLRADGLVVPHWGVACGSGIKISGGTTQL